MSNLQKYLQLEIDSEGRLTLVLEDWDHRDYIEDVLAEHFDIEYEYASENTVSKKWTLYFGKELDSTLLNYALQQINSHHSGSGTLYETI